MPRQVRLIVPGFPHHIVQRGQDRQPVLDELADRSSIIVENRGRPILDGVKGIELVNSIDWVRMCTQTTAAATGLSYECG